jgi:hypothetical protein
MIMEQGCPSVEALSRIPSDLTVSSHEQADFLWSGESLENIHGFPGGSEDRGGDVAGFFAGHQARRGALALGPFR